MQVKRKSTLLSFPRGLYRIISFVKIEKNSGIWKSRCGYMEKPVRVYGKAGAGIGKAGAGIGKAAIWK
jgi:hypothetical protein